MYPCLPSCGRPGTSLTSRTSSKGFRAPLSRQGAPGKLHTPAPFVVSPLLLSGPIFCRVLAEWIVDKMGFGRAGCGQDGLWPCRLWTGQALAERVVDKMGFGREGYGQDGLWQRGLWTRWALVGRAVDKMGFGRAGCGQDGLWQRWFVGEMGFGRAGCGQDGLWQSGLWVRWALVVWVVGKMGFGRVGYGHLWTGLALAERVY